MKLTFEKCINIIVDFLTESSTSPNLARANAGVNQTRSSVQARLGRTKKVIVIVAVVVKVVVVVVESRNHFLVSRFLRIGCVTLFTFQAGWTFAATCMR